MPRIKPVLPEKYRTRNRDGRRYTPTFVPFLIFPIGLSRSLAPLPETWYDRLAANIGGSGCNKPSGVTQIISLGRPLLRQYYMTRRVSAYATCKVEGKRVMRVLTRLRGEGEPLVSVCFDCQSTDFMVSLRGNARRLLNGRSTFPFTSANRVISSTFEARNNRWMNDVCRAIDVKLMLERILKVKSRMDIVRDRV